MTEPEAISASTRRTPVLPYKQPGTTGGHRPPRPPVLSVLLTGPLLLVAIILVGHPFARMLPHGWEAAAFVEVPTGRLNKYNRPAVFYIGAHGTGRNGGTVMDGAYVKYTGEPASDQMNVDLRAMTYRLNLYRNEQVHIPGRPLSRDAVLGYVVSAGFDPAFAETGVVADGLWSELQGLAAGRLPPDVTGQPYAGQVPSRRHLMTGTDVVNLGEFGHLLWVPWYTPYCLPVWMLAWWAAGWWLVRRYRRKLCAARDGRGP